ncbi:leucine--tRNA ligase [Vescimonas fastidiosa]|uniref:Leucine--tRNA ligase n=1 Tax=Vescimonas fastidiosa TaxID=2714353 RepID=A0A810PP40_9FIRM|nr:leucine--tRNA ligase [Vescimonas fastidiosa]BCK78579.1 leucine--tRNA ligase [Vescimonas fastidiosa]
MQYDFAAIEKKWQDNWEKTKPYRAVTGDKTRKKFYGLIEFPYPSAAGLHVGHPRPFTALDVVTRKKRMEGYNVLFPIGFDAFGLPTENFAIKNHVHPAVVTQENIKNFTRQLKMLGYGFDWDRCVDTTDPQYYKWTQWIFLQLFKHGLAYKTTMPVNWCTSCKCVLANEEVVEGVCERCGSEVVRKEKSQWMLRITKYADRLIDDLDDLDFIERVKIQQKNWIGRSTGTEVTFKTNMGDDVTVYTTRADTLFGTTYMVISPEHPLLKKWKDQIANWAEVEEYQAAAARKSDFERGELNKDKTGVRLEGVQVINPVTGGVLPMFVSDYVLMGYGTGIVMGVPGHDQRDWDFAKKFGLPIVEVVKGGDVTKEAFVAKDDKAIMVNSGFLNGMTVKEAIPAMKKYAVEQGWGKEKVNFKLRDWVFSRQRYWGEPIPLVNCEKCGWVAIPESDLPLVLPKVESYEPTDDGESPLSKMTDWVNTTCPCCGGPAKRETDTMPQWAGSSWYFLRYMDPHNDKELVGKEAEEYWGPVDWYNGGMEHTTLHLLYSRFWHKFLYDIGVVHTKEPYAKRTSHGMILGKNPHYVGNAKTEEEKQALREKYGAQAERPAVKMSKSLGNVVNPDDVIKAYGADTMRLYIMFIGDFEKTASWSDEAVKGSKRFLDRCWNLMDRVTDDPEISQQNMAAVHKTIKKVTNDIDELKMNTAIAALMALVNDFYAKGLSKGDLEALLKLLSPFAPHMVEEMWELMGYAQKYGKMCMQMPWPGYDESKTIDATAEMAVQVNGKLKGTVVVPTDSDEQTVVAAAMELEKVKKSTEGMTVVKTILVKNKLVNLIVKPAK